MGFKPDAKQGNMYDKKYYGLHVPAQEDFDYMNEAKIGAPPKKQGTGNMFLDGFLSIDERHISDAVQDQFNDNGEVKKIEPSKTFSGHARGKNGRGKGKGRRY